MDQEHGKKALHLLDEDSPDFIRENEFLMKNMASRLTINKGVIPVTVTNRE